MNKRASPDEHLAPVQLLLKTADACKTLGGIHPRTLSRLEQRGLISSVKLVRHKLWAAEDLRGLVAKHQVWESTQQEEQP
jgi:hypothetical protein